MKVVILAAGKGERLLPLTADKPKAMVEILGKSMLVRQLELLKSSGLNDISIVVGYKKETIEKLGYPTYCNENFSQTNMVYSLMQAKELFNGDDDILITYSDIVYDKILLEKVLNFKGEFGIVVNKKWQSLWELRMENPLDDVESLKTKNEKIIEIGKKPKSLDDVEGQYTGIIYIGKKFANEFISAYSSMDKDKIYDRKTHPNMFMTSYLQHFFDLGKYAQKIEIDGHWLEVDTIEDLEVYEGLHKKKNLNTIINIESY